MGNSKTSKDSGKKETETTKSSVIKGTVKSPNKLMAAGVLVTAFTDGKIPKPIGEGFTDSNGNFEIPYPSIALTEGDKEGTNISVRISRPSNILDIKKGATHLITTPVFEKIKPNTTIDVVLDKEIFVVTGFVKSESGHPISDVVVRAYDRDLRTSTLLGEFITEKDGRYSIFYSRDSFRRHEKGTADIVLEIFRIEDLKRTTKKLPAEPFKVTPIHFNVPLVAKIDVIIGDDKPKLAEYDHIVKEISPLVEDIAIENGTDSLFSHRMSRLVAEDSRFIIYETGIEPDKIASLKWCHQQFLDKSVHLNPEYMYGLVRTNFERNLRGILRKNGGDWKKAIEESVKKLIIKSPEEESLQAFYKQLHHLKINAELRNQLPGSNFTHDGLLSLTKASLADKQTFIDAYLNKGSLDRYFWHGLKEQDSISKKIRTEIHLVYEIGKSLAYHVPLIKILRESYAISAHKDLAKLDRRDWKRLLNIICGGDESSIQPRDKRDEIENLAKSYEGKFEAEYPVVAFHARMNSNGFEGAILTTENKKDSQVKREKANINSGVQKFFANNPDFNLSKPLFNNKLLFEKIKMDGADMELVLPQLQSIHRVFQISPRFHDVNILMRGGIHSAQSIVRMGKDSFVNKFSEDLKEDIDANEDNKEIVLLAAKQKAASLYDKAVGIHRAAIGLTAHLSQNFNNVDFWVNRAKPGSNGGSSPGTSNGTTLRISNRTNRIRTTRGLIRTIPGTTTPGTTGTSSQKVSITDIPELKELFSQTSYCSCKECRSVYSPAAYLVDLLHFLSKNTVPIPGSNETLLHKLLEKRPEINNILLNCDNTFTPIPYVDLVLEILENAVIKDEGALPAYDEQTRDEAEELAVLPQYQKQQVYDNTLAKAIYPHTLSFDINTEIAKLYIPELGLSRVELMEKFFPRTGTITIPNSDLIKRYILRNRIIAAEILNLNDGDWVTLTGYHYITSGMVTRPHASKYFGLDNTVNYPVPGDDTIGGPQIDWIEYLSYAEIFIKRTGITTFAEAKQLVDTDFINKSRDFYWLTNDLTCDIRDVRLTSINNSYSVDVNAWKAALEQVLTRIPPFIRLCSRLGWSYRELEAVLTAFNIDTLQKVDQRFLVKLSHLIRAKNKFNLAIEDILVFWSNIATASYTDYLTKDQPRVKSQFEKLFLNKAVVYPFDSAFHEDGTLSAGQLTDPLHKSTICAGLELSSDEFDWMTLTAGLVTNQLTLSNLSILYRYKLLSRSLNVPIKTLSCLRELSGIDPFDSNTANMILFIDAVGAFRSSKLSIEEYDYILRNNYDFNKIVRVVDDKLDDVLHNLNFDIAEILVENPTLSTLPLPDLLSDTADIKKQGEKIAEKLALLNYDGEVTKRSVDIFLSSIPLTGLSQPDKDFLKTHFKYFETSSVPLETLSVTLPNGPNDYCFYDSGTKELWYVGIMDDLVKTNLLRLPNASPGFKFAVKQLFQASQHFQSPTETLFLTDTEIADLGTANEVLTPATDATKGHQRTRLIKILVKLNSYLQKKLLKQKLLESLSEPLKIDALSLLVLLVSIRKSFFTPHNNKLYDDFEKLADANPDYGALIKSFRYLERICKLVEHLNLSADEIIFVTGHGNIFSAYDLVSGADKPFDISKFPDVPGDYKAWIFDQLEKIRLYKFLNTVFISNDHSLDDFLTSPISHPNPTNAEIADIKLILESISGWDQAAIEKLRVASDCRDGLNSLVWLKRFHDCQKLVSLTKVGADDLTNWACAFPDSSISKQIVLAVKSNYSLEEWLKKGKEIRDKLREKQRAALVDYLVGANEYESSDQLFDDYLVDVEMSPCRMTTRIRLAIDSVQLFVNRCLLNLEGDLGLNETAVLEWDWMKNYRVWEANRKVFLYPENYIEPELRDDKTFLFKELENELRQNQLTNDVIEEAFLNYLGKLERVAMLQICGMYEEVETDTIDPAATKVFSSHSPVLTRPSASTAPTSGNTHRIDPNPPPSGPPYGCKDPAASNYTPGAINDNRDLCTYDPPPPSPPDPIYGCTNPAAKNYDENATKDDGSCIVPGCTNPAAKNYDENATEDDGNCILDPLPPPPPPPPPHITVPKKTLHVFGRTRETPHEYYYRKLIDNSYWTPWEKVPVDIEGDHLIPVVYNGRIYLFWPIFEEINESPIGKIEEAVMTFASGITEKVAAIYKGMYGLTEGVTVITSQFVVELLESLKVIIPKELNWVPSNFSPSGWIEACKNRIHEMRQQLFPNVTDPWHYSNQQLRDLSSAVSDATFWALNPDINEFINIASKKWRIKLMFAEYKNKKWSEKKESKQYLEYKDLIGAFIPNKKRVFTFKAVGEQRPLQIWCYLQNDSIYPSFNKSEAVGAFELEEAHGVLNAINNDVDALRSFLENDYWIKGEEVNDENDTNNPPKKIRKEKEIPLLFNMKQGEPHSPWDAKNSPQRTIVQTSTGIRVKEETNVFGSWKSIPISGDGSISNQEAYRIIGLHQYLGDTKDNPFFFHYKSKSFYVEKKLNYLYFWMNYHPNVYKIMIALNRYGTSGILKTDLHYLDYYSEYNQFPQDYNPSYSHPQGQDWDAQREAYDFTFRGLYSQYNWEFFFHAPFLIANRLSLDQKFRESLKWYHYIFNPTTHVKDVTAPQRFWITKPFREKSMEDYEVQEINHLLNVMIGTEDESATNDPYIEDLLHSIQRWRDDAFNPHLIARYRTTAFQKSVVMKYLDNLIAWGDYLFKQETTESINEATQLYVFAHKILGDRPQEIIVSEKLEDGKSWKDFDEKMLDAFGNVNIESLLPPAGPECSQFNNNNTSLSNGLSLHPHYFCIPPNEKLLSFWDTVEDRLFKIRHCQNIEGEVLNIPIFGSPIDPGLLVRAQAAGLNLSEVINDLNTPVGPYRFTFMLQKANEFCNDVKSFGSSLLSALEKKDSEKLSQIRNSHELRILEANREIKQLQLQDAIKQKENLEISKLSSEVRLAYYTKNLVEFINPFEGASLLLNSASLIIQALGSAAYLAGVPAFLVPNLKAGFVTTLGAMFGGANSGGSVENFGRGMSSIASTLSATSGIVSTVGSYVRRAEDWALQIALITNEIRQLEKQIISSEIKISIAQKELNNHDMQIANNKEIDEFMRSKFSNYDLYDWMVTQISKTYFDSYKLAFDLAKAAQKCFDYEMGNFNGNRARFIQYGRWDSLYKGLLSGEMLQNDLRKMEAEYYKKNEREFELTKQISLALLNPEALLLLKNTGSCEYSLPEILFDIDCPGDYLRRIKSVSISIPCITGPFTTISAKLALRNNHIRINPISSPDLLSDMTNGYHNYGPIKSISTSNAQNDSGLFELNFRDDRYLPFEGQGVVSDWNLELPAILDGTSWKGFKQFDYNTISDVIITMRYTSRPGGDTFKGEVRDSINTKINSLLNANGLPRAFSLKHEFPDEWHLFKNSTDVNRKLNMKFNERFFPLFAKDYTISAVKVGLFVKPKDNSSSSSANLYIGPQSPPPSPIPFTMNSTNHFTDGPKPIQSNGNIPDTSSSVDWVLSMADTEVSKTDDIVMVVYYNLS